MTKAIISIVIGTYNRKKMLANCLSSIRNNRISIPYEIIVVDGGSSDGTLEWLIKQKDIITIIQHNREQVNNKLVMKRSWGYFMNLGFKASEGDFICMLSDDCYIHKDAVIKGYEVITAETDVGGCVFPFRNSLVDDVFMYYKTVDEKNIINYGIYKKEVIAEVGWANEDDYKFYFSDIDLSLKIWKSGNKIIISRASLVEHLRHEFDPLRQINEMEKEGNQDYIQFKKIWSNEYDFTEERSVAVVSNLDIRIPNDISKFMPKGVEFKIVLIDRYLKKIIQKDSFIYTIFKKIKQLFLDRSKA